MLTILFILVIQTRRWGWSTLFVQLSASGSWDSGFESRLRHIYHLTERDSRMPTCIASDVRDRVRNRGQDNVTNINTGSGVRRIIFKSFRGVSVIWKLAEFLREFSRSSPRNLAEKKWSAWAFAYEFSPRKFAYENFFSRSEREKRAFFLGWSVYLSAEIWQNCLVLTW